MSSYDQYLKIKMCSLGISGQMRHRKMTPDVLAHTTAHHTNVCVCVLYSMAKKRNRKKKTCYQITKHKSKYSGAQNFFFFLVEC